MKCKFATKTDKKWFDDIEVGKRVNFACKCAIFECRCPGRLPPNNPPLDAAGIHSRRRFYEDGRQKEDFIVVRSKYCNSKTCKSYESKKE